MESREELAYFPLLREKVLERPGLLEIWFIRPVEGKPI